MHKRRFTVSEIAQRLSVVDDLEGVDHANLNWRVRHIARAGHLEGGERIDARGTLAFPVAELCRARILTALASLTCDLPSIAPMISRAAADARPGLLPSDWPGRTKVDGGHAWRGFADIVAGVAAGEAWTLRIAHYAPGHTHGQRTVASFVYGDTARPGTDAAFGGAPLATINFDLQRLFAGLIH